VSERKLRADLAKVQYEREIEAQKLVYCYWVFNLVSTKFSSRYAEEEYQALVEEEMERMATKRSEPKVKEREEL
jgi:hypothetical protein